MSRTAASGRLRREACFRTCEAARFRANSERIDSCRDQRIVRQTHRHRPVVTRKIRATKLRWSTGFPLHESVLKRQEPRQRGSKRKRLRCVRSGIEGSGDGKIFSRNGDFYALSLVPAASPASSSIASDRFTKKSVIFAVIGFIQFVQCPELIVVARHKS